ncbi:MAG TPA: tyrosine-type recombinase/integrase, partial [Candidatus Thermoplasmatota archaeon]|nr:tyrosine-type recombinase/integrase [Candidatus Thermoplasmatota archaeon]
MRDRGYRPFTARTYAQALGPFLVWARTLTPAHEMAPRYREYLLFDAKNRRGEDLSATRVRNSLTAIERYFEWVENPLPRPMRKPQGKRRTPRYLTVEEVQQLLFVCDNRRDYALLHVLVYGGLRASECANLKVGDLRERELTIREGKGGKDRIVVLAPKAVDAIHAYMG